MATVEVTDATFADTVLLADKPVLVDYWADWCGPCRQLAPIIEELSNTYGDRMIFAKVDTNSNTGTAAQQGIMSLPTLQLFQGGRVVAQLQGGQTKAKLIKTIEQFI